ncbi:MAG: nucleotidyltransferase domain-containing protein [Patescibacteria group bacterium]
MKISEKACRQTCAGGAGYGAAIASRLAREEWRVLKELLKDANAFNMKARYDTYRLSFHKKATKQFTEKYFAACAALRLWLFKRTTKKNAIKYAADFASYLKQDVGFPFKAVYLYGSYANGTQRDWSDIDVAVVSEKFKGRVDPFMYLWRRVRDIDTERGIEPVGFHPRDFVWENPLAAEVKQYGIRIRV